MPPSTWLAGRRDGDRLVVEVHDGGEVTAHEYAGAEGIVDGELAFELGFEDLAIDGEAIVVVTCCEPVSGSAEAYRSAPSADPVAVAQAVRIDLHDGTLARTDGSGFAALRPSWLDGGGDVQPLELDMTFDIALVPAAEGPVVALVDAGRPPDALRPPPAEPALASVRLDGTTVRTIPLDAEVICGVVPMEGTTVGVLAGETHEGCLAHRLLRIDVDNGEVAGEVALVDGVRRANTDASGRYLIAVTDAGGLVCTTSVRTKGVSWRRRAATRRRTGREHTRTWRRRDGETDETSDAAGVAGRGRWRGPHPSAPAGGRGPRRGGAIGRRWPAGRGACAGPPDRTRSP